MRFQRFKAQRLRYVYMLCLFIALFFFTSCGGGKADECVNCSQSKPVAKITPVNLVTPKVQKDAAVTFSGLQSYDNAGTALTYNWNLYKLPAASESTPPTLLTSSTLAEGVRYTPTQSGNYKMVLTVSNGVSTSNPTEYVFNVNTRPVPNNMDFYLNEDIPTTIKLNAVDADADPITYYIMPDGLKGLVSLKNSSTGEVTYTPLANSSDSDTFSYSVTDGIENSSTASVTLHITPVNDSPVAYPLGPFKLSEDTSYSGQLNATDVDSNTLIYTIISQPPKGVVELVNAQSGAFRYTPNANINGSDSFIYIANDGLLNSAQAVVSLSITPVNDPPVPKNNISFTTAEDTTYEGLLIGNDTDGDPLSFAITSNPSKGVVKINDISSGSFTYTPNLNANGSDSFYFKVNDSTVDSGPVPVSITINPVNDLPSAQASSYTTNEDTPVTGKLDGSDVDDDSLTFKVTSPSEKGGTVSVTRSLSSDDFRYTPAKDFNGTDVFSFVSSDSKADSQPEKITIQVFPVNDAPVANSLTPTTNEDTPLNSTLQGSDVDNDPITYKIAQNPSKGTLTLDANTGVYSYTPLANMNGPITFTYNANDGVLDSNPAVVTITISPVNDKPVANAGKDSNVVLGKDASLDATGSSDVDGDPLSYKWSFVSVPQGTSPEFQPNANDSKPKFNASKLGQYVVSLVVNDGKVDSEPNNVTITARNEIDLEISTLDLSGVTVDPTSLNVSGQAKIQIYNNEAMDSLGYPFMVTLFEDSKTLNQAYDKDKDIVLGTYKVTQTIPANSSITVTVDMTGTSQFLGNLVYGCVDSDKEVAESDEENNVFYNQTAVCAPPSVDNSKPEIEWEWPGSRQIEYPESNQVITTPIVADINNDQMPDIIFVTFAGTEYNTNGVLRAISGNGSCDLFSLDKLDGTSYRPHPKSTIAVGNIDDDAALEITVVVKGETEVGIAIVEVTPVNSCKCTVKTQAISTRLDLKNDLATALGSIYLANIYQGMPIEILLGNYIISGSDAKTLWNGAYDTGKFNSISARISDSFTPVVFAGRTAYNIENIEPNWDASGIREDGFVAIANIVSSVTDTNSPEIVLVADGGVSILDKNGNILVKKTRILESLKGGPPTIADFDGDGKPDIGVAGEKQFFVFNANLDIIKQWDITNHEVENGSCAFDFDNDGKSEFVFRDESHLYIFSNTGKVTFGDFKSQTAIEIPVVVDVDNDRHAEIVVGINKYNSDNTHCGIQVYGDSNGYWVNTGKIWNQHAYNITNVNDNGKVPELPQKSWEKYNGFRQNKIDNPNVCHDLTASKVQINTDNCPNSVTIGVRIGNGSNSSVSNPSGTTPIAVAIYDGDPNVADPPAKLISTKNITRTLMAGDFEDITVTYGAFATGEHTIHVVADKANVIWETNESNNKVSTSFRCQ